MLLEFRAEDPAIEIKPHHKMSIGQANKEMLANGFALEYDGEFYLFSIFSYTKSNKGVVAV